MIIAKYGNSVNVTEALLDRQNALRAARQEYNPRTQYPHNAAQFAAWQAYWRPVWQAEAEEEQREAGRRHRLLGLELATCSTDLMREGWHEASRQIVTGYEYRMFDRPITDCTTAAMRHGYQERIAEEQAEAVMEEADAKPGLNVDDDVEDWWLDDDEYEMQWNSFGDLAGRI